MKVKTLKKKKKKTHCIFPHPLTFLCSRKRQWLQTVKSYRGVLIPTGRKEWACLPKKTWTLFLKSLACLLRKAFRNQICVYWVTCAENCHMGAFLILNHGRHSVIKTSLSSWTIFRCPPWAPHAWQILRRVFAIHPFISFVRNFLCSY